MLFIFSLAYPQKLFTQVFTNFNARAVLYEMGVRPEDIIENVKIIRVTAGTIQGFDVNMTEDESIGVPSHVIYDFIREDNIILLKGASGYVAENGEIIITADYIYISAVRVKIGFEKYLVVGQSLKDIADFLLFGKD